MSASYLVLWPGRKKLTRQSLSPHPYRPTLLYWLTPITPVPAARLAHAGWSYLGLAARHFLEADGETVTEGRAYEILFRGSMTLGPALPELRAPRLISPIDFDRWQNLFSELGKIDRLGHQQILELGCTVRGKAFRHLGHVAHEPARLARLAFHWTRGAIKAYGYESVATFAALLLMGAAVTGLEMGGDCELCYRRCIPWQQRCPEHSRHRRYSDRDKTIRVNVRRALKRNPNPQQFQQYEADSVRCARVLSAAIWSARPADVDAWRVDLQAALRNSPRVAALFPRGIADQPVATIHRSLRTQLDSLENDLQSWPGKVRQAQLWLEADSPSPSKDSATQARAQVQQAIALHNDGFTIRQIAERFGLVPESLKRAMAREKKRTAP